MKDDELTPEERAAFAALPREAYSGDLLEERTVRALADQGLLHRRRAFGARPVLAWVAAAAACLIFFVAGFTMGQNRSVTTTAQSGSAPSKQGTQRAIEHQTPPRNPAGATTVAQSETSGAEGMRYVLWF